MFEEPVTITHPTPADAAAHVRFETPNEQWTLGGECALTLRTTQPTGKIRMATQTDDTIRY